jgi:hypothetical protein
MTSLEEELPELGLEETSLEYNQLLNNQEPLSKVYFMKDINNTFTMRD